MTSQANHVRNKAPPDQVEGWDFFQADAQDRSSTSERKYDRSLMKWYVILKIVTMLVVFAVTLLAGVVSKGATFFMVSQVAAKTKTHNICLTDFPPTLPPDSELMVGITDREKVGWIWAIFFSFLAPEIFTFFRSVRIVLMKTFKKPSFLEFSIVAGFETFHVIGVTILFFLALPGMDSIRAIMATNAVALFPGMLKIFMKPPLGSFGGRFKLHYILSILAVLIQVSALVVWPVMDVVEKKENDIDHSWALPVGLLLTSFGWWECYVEEEGHLSKLWNVKTLMTDGGARGFTYLFISLWKIAVFFASILVISTVSKIVPSLDFLFTEFTAAFESNEYFLRYPDSSYLKMMVVDQLVRWDKLWKSPAIVLLVQIGCSWITYIFGKFACKCNIQQLCFALPISLVTPVCIFTLIPLCYYRLADACAFSSSFPKHLFFECPSEISGNWIVQDIAFLWILFYISHLWITFQIWTPKSRRLAETTQIFGSDFYNSLMVDISMMLNRRNDDGERSKRFDTFTKHFSNRAQQEEEAPRTKKRRKISAWSEQTQEFNDISIDDNTVRIKGCATMWHETEEEIEEMLKSIFRIDEDYCARKLAFKMQDVTDDYYEWESHIFFDDCMMTASDVQGEQTVNTFVVDLVNSVEKFGKKWYGKRKLGVGPPIKMETPYGGRIIWTLPGETKIICHLKDKNKIRHKKRWSQIMYMYYFLGYQLMEDKTLTSARKEVRSENTFLLALDGDVDFQPEAIIKVVDLMKRNPKVGAACGRIHPTGTGVMQWYQKFEYAIGHWMQKATEHVLGCVLCSPGCFSLFRGRAVMDDNVMKTYTTVASQPKHFVQYDQGEDRWLCTLLLKQGWRVEYSAASDSFTACPMTFKEFYNQRRRWMPSTLLNVIDLIQDYKVVVKNNDDISYLYIGYQLLNLVGTMIGPGSIFLMLIGAFNIAFGLTNTESLILNTVLVSVFTLSCCFLKSDHQIRVAEVLTIIYAIIMIAVYVGILLQIAEDGPLSLSAIGFYCTFGSFIVAAILHPQEFWCITCAVIYVCTIPSMYLLLMIYSLFNMNNVSWGTREVPKTEEQKAAEAQAQAQKEVKVAEKKGHNGLLGYFQSMADTKKKGNMELSLGNIFSCLCCTAEDETDNKKELMMMADKLDKIEKALKIKSNDNHEPVINTVAAPPPTKPDTTEEPIKVKVDKPKRVRIGGAAGPYWMEKNEENLRKCEILAKAKQIYLQEDEANFWKDMIEKYLKPLDEDKDQKKRVEEGLRELKNSFSMGFVLINVLWVTAIFMLQTNTEVLGMKWPIGGKGPEISFDTSNPEAANLIYLQYEYLRLEPVGVVFVFAFIFIIALQLLGMFSHRILTLGHIISSTNITFSKRNKLDVNEYIKTNIVDIIKDVADNIEPEEGGRTLAEAVEESIMSMDEDMIRRMSNTDTGRKLQRKETVRALQGNTKRYGERRETMRRRTIRVQDNVPSTIAEDEEESPSPSVPVVRTKSTIDPDGFEYREV